MFADVCILASTRQLAFREAHSYFDIRFGVAFLPERFEMSELTMIKTYVWRFLLRRLVTRSIGTDELFVYGTRRMADFLLRGPFVEVGQV